MTLEGATVAMETEFPDAPSDVLTETSAQEQRRKVKSLSTATGNIFY